MRIPGVGPISALAYKTWSRSARRFRLCPGTANGAGEHGGVHGASELRVRYGSITMATDPTVAQARGQQTESKSPN
jgi:hypothetical protein